MAGLAVPVAHICAQVGQLVAAAVVILEEEEDEIEEALMRNARIAVMEVMEMEEGVRPGDNFEGELWVAITVDINEYHRMGDPCFKLHFRMSRGTFEELCATLYSHLVGVGRLRRQRTPFQDIVLMVVWIMATPDSFRSVALRFGVRPSTLYYFYSYIIEALRELAPRFITWPDAEERAEISDSFLRTTGMPGVVSCIDGTYVDIIAPKVDPAHYVNRHHQYSLNVQVVVDNTLLVRDLHVGEPGSMNDKRVLRRSPLYDKLLYGQALSAEYEHLVGDGGYELTDFLIIPFRDNGHLTEIQTHFNKTLSQCRVRVENGFALAKEKWRRLKFLHARNQEVVVDHITACFVVHNFLILHGETVFEEEELARRIRDNEVLEDPVVINEEPEEYNQRIEDAKIRGDEKRLWLIEFLPDMED